MLSTIAATTAGLNIAAAGWMSNLTVYLIKEFGMNSIDAAEVSNVMNGSVNFVPVIAAVLADSFFGTFFLVWISSLVSLLVCISPSHFTLFCKGKLLYFIHLT